MEILNYMNLKLWFHKYKLFRGMYYLQRAKTLKDAEKYKKALKKLFKAKRNLDAIIHDHGVSTTLINNIGDVYYHLNQFDQALYYFHKAEKMIDLNRLDVALIYKIYKNLALCYKTKRDYKTYIHYLLICLDYEKDTLHKAHILLELSHAYRMLEDFHQALSYSKNALNTYEGIKPFPSFEIGNSYLAMGLTYIETDQFHEAVEYLEKTEEIYEKISIKNQNKLYLYELLEYSFFNMGYKDTAILYRSKYNQLIINPES